jgi:hypothetical protein
VATTKRFISQSPWCGAPWPYDTAKLVVKAFFWIDKWSSWIWKCRRPAGGKDKRRPP